MFNKNSILAKYGPTSQTTERDPHPAKLPSNPFGASDASSQGTVKPIPSPAEKAIDSPVATTNTAEEDAGSRLVVGPNVKLKGAEIDDCDILVVEGRVEATMDSRVLRVAQNGAFSGKVGIDIAEIRGRFDGELTARSQLIIHATGRVNGTIRYGKILVEEGGELSGDIRSLASSSEGNGQERGAADSKAKSGNLAH
jgi:cytoskeletal protein CcmA (bactofilin family)